MLFSDLRIDEEEFSKLNVEKIDGELKIAGLSSGDYFLLKKNDIMVFTGDFLVRNLEG